MLMQTTRVAHSNLQVQLVPIPPIVPQSNAATTNKSAPRNRKKADLKLGLKNGTLLGTKCRFGSENAKRVA